MTEAAPSLRGFRKGGYSGYVQRRILIPSDPDIRNLTARIPIRRKPRLLRNSAFLLQGVLEAKAKHKILHFGSVDFEFRNSPKPCMECLTELPN